MARRGHLCVERRVFVKGLCHVEFFFVKSRHYIFSRATIFLLLYIQWGVVAGATVASGLGGVPHSVIYLTSAFFWPRGAGGVGSEPERPLAKQLLGIWAGALLTWEWRSPWERSLNIFPRFFESLKSPLPW